ncbi:MAG: tRNA lysidine(34) synthetase TilS [Bacteroidetes bacterium]|nr:tRNA lysidine(34) synthetase TilS [Bacteroidota bacterium]
MIQQLQQFIAQHHLFEPSDKLLLTVSGGKDSMVMLHLFQQLPYQITVAHCNYGLRGEESDAEEVFVRDYCKKFEIPFFVKRFDIPQYMKEHKVSIQEAARDLRYNWFNEISIEQGLDKILTAHHKTDHLETIILQLVRGTGIKGLHGIMVSQNKLIRPLLFTTSSDIQKYANEHNVKFKEDSSNEKLVYRRNLVRKKILPVLFEMNPEVENTFYKFSEHMLSYESIIDQYIAKEMEKVEVKKSDGNWIITIDELRDHQYANLISWL